MFTRWKTALSMGTNLEDVLPGLLLPIQIHQKLNFFIKPFDYTTLLHGTRIRTTDGFVSLYRRIMVRIVMARP